MTTTDPTGLALTGAGTPSLRYLEQAQHELLCYVGDPLSSINEAIALSPACVMAHYLQAYLYLVGTEASGLAPVMQALDRAEGLAHNERETRHRAAVRKLAEGRYEAAVGELQAVLTEYPRDILALQVAHLFDFFRGDARNLRGRPAQVRHAWSENDAWYHAVLGMHAFGLEECNLYEQAEQAGQQAIALNPLDSWAHHAVAHVYEMQGEQHKGIAWMESREPFWAENNFFAIHNWWHLAIFYLDLDETDKVLELYDQRLRGTDSRVILDLIDASALLWRLKLRNVDVGQRWTVLADAWTPLATEDLYAFNNFHAVMAFVGAQQWKRADEVIDTLVERLTRNGDNQAMTRDVGLPASRAIYSFGRAEYQKAVDLLLPIRTIAQRFGGSHAQRDIIDLTLIEAALRSHQHSLVKALASERVLNKPSSPLSRRYLQA